MKEKEILGLMKEIPFFKPFTLNEKKIMASTDSHIVEYKKGEYVIRQGEKDSTIFMLLKGSLAIRKDEVLDAELNTLNLGTMFGGPFEYRKISVNERNCQEKSSCPEDG